MLALVPRTEERLGASPKDFDVAAVIELRVDPGRLCQGHIGLHDQDTIERPGRLHRKKPHAAEHVDQRFAARVSRGPGAHRFDHETVGLEKIFAADPKTATADGNVHRTLRDAANGRIRGNGAVAGENAQLNGSGRQPGHDGFLVVQHPVETVDEQRAAIDRDDVIACPTEKADRPGVTIDLKLGPRAILPGLRSENFDRRQLLLLADALQALHEYRLLDAHLCSGFDVLRIAAAARRRKRAGRGHALGRRFPDLSNGRDRRATVTSGYLGFNDFTGQYPVDEDDTVGRAGQALTAENDFFDGQSHRVIIRPRPSYTLFHVGRQPPRPGTMTFLATLADRDDEILDLVDDENRVVATVRRGDCHGNPSCQHRAVHVFVVNRGAYFLQKRSLAKRIQPGRWDTSVGGHVLSGETYEQAAVKELAEEIGVVVPDASACRRSHDYVWKSPVETEHIRTFILEHEGPFSLQPEEIDEGRFFTVAEMLAAIGTGTLTPNLEVELVQLGLVGGPTGP
jgi:isopentenyldiphosphate isomerase